MHSELTTALKEIGCQLDNNIFPQIKNGGIVMPSEFAVPSTLGKETTDGSSRQRREEARSQTKAFGWQGVLRRAWSPCQAAPVICTDIKAQYETEVDAVQEAYPNTKVWHQAEGMWLLTESSVLPGLHKKAIFLTGIPFAQSLAVRSWGFWDDSIIGYSWIGPRHTNFPDGSVCAFESTDKTWVTKDSIVELLDLYTLWALRHLYLELFGRWPGRQAVHRPYERILELREDEFCGCYESGKRYGECCQKKISREIK
jgi:hypothetical protein